MPILAFLDTPLWGQSLASIFWRISGIVMGLTLGMTWTHDFLRWRQTRQLAHVVAETKKQSRELLDQTSSAVGDANEVYDKAQNTLNQARALLEVTIIASQRMLEVDDGISKAERAERLDNLRKAQEMLKASASDDK